MIKLSSAFKKIINAMSRSLFAAGAVNDVVDQEVESIRVNVGGPVCASRPNAADDLPLARSPRRRSPPQPLAHFPAAPDRGLSQRRLAPAFGAIDISGWLDLVRDRGGQVADGSGRETRARSACATRIASSAARWLVMSVMMP